MLSIFLYISYCTFSSDFDIAFTSWIDWLKLAIYNKKIIFWFTGMKLPRLKFPVHMITVFGTWHGIRLDIFFAGRGNHCYLFSTIFLIKEFPVYQMFRDISTKIIDFFFFWVYSKFNVSLLAPLCVWICHFLVFVPHSGFLSYFILFYSIATDVPLHWSS